jgi:hypothetical protein
MSKPFLIRALAASGALALLGACEPVEIGQNPTPNAALGVAAALSDGC